MEISVGRRLRPDGTAIVTVAGDVDFANADDLAQGLCEVVSAWHPAVLRVDLDGASFIDSTGLGALIVGYRSATDAGTAFAVVNPTPGFLRVLSVTGLCEMFGLSPQQQEATAPAA